jgi:serine/threonine protein kinase
MPLKPGRVPRDQYQILGLIGRGGFGFVCHTSDTLINKPVVRSA